MSDKRFSLISVEYGIFEDNSTGKGFDIYKCLDILNELAEQNEELKKKNKELTIIAELQDECITHLTTIDVTNQTEQEKWLKKRIIDALDDCPKKKVGYLVMEMKDKGDFE